MHLSFCSPTSSGRPREISAGGSSEFGQRIPYSAENGKSVLTLPAIAIRRIQSKAAGKAAQ